MPREKKYTTAELHQMLEEQEKAEQGEPADENAPGEAAEGAPAVAPPPRAVQAPPRPPRPAPPGPRPRPDAPREQAVVLARAGSTKLAEIDAKSYAVVQLGRDAIREIIADNLAGLGSQLTERDFPRIRVPAGGAMAWKLVTAEGDASQETFDGVIIHTQPARVYWREKLGKTAPKPPDCVSRDGYSGLGDPGGDCATCPMASFGSADGGGGRGQACKQMNLVFIVRENQIVPEVVALPPTSLGSLKQYLLALSSAGFPKSAVVTRFKLKAAQNAAQITYAKAEFAAVGRLNAQGLSVFQGLGADLRRSMGYQVIEAMVAQEGAAASGAGSTESVAE